MLQSPRISRLLSPAALVILLGCSTHHAGAAPPSVDKPRVIVTTDGEADDRCSMVRFLLTSNEFDVEGIVNSSSQFHWVGGQGWNAFHPVSWVEEQIGLYARVYDNLLLHDPAYPSPEYLLSRWKVGNISGIGEQVMRSEGAELIAKVLLDDSDPRPVWVQAWGGTNTIARALRIIEEEHPSRMQEVADKLRLFLIWEQDSTYQDSIRPKWEELGVTTIISDQFDALAYIWRNALPEATRPYFEAEWMKKNILDKHGPLCAAYESLDGAFQAEGDTPAFLHLLPNGLRSTESPGWGGWGGRYVNVRNNVWMDPPPDAEWDRPAGRWFIDNSWSKKLEDAASPREQEVRTRYFKPIWRWLQQVQNDFAARADWSVKDYASANHHPVIRLKGTPLDIEAVPGEVLTLDASPTTDPDGDKLDFRWWHYVEAGTYTGSPLVTSNQPRTVITIPADARAGDEMHVICEVTDQGSPPLTRYQRVVIRVRATATAAAPHTGPYQATWESLAAHDEAPQWLLDAKFGIYFHWGVYTVPAYGDEWYPHWMHFPDRKEFAHHINTYGPHSEFGYHDFVPLFKAERFDPAGWSELFRKAGARFAGGVAEHHDGFAMWDSEVTPWNAMDKGPHRDVIGELAREIRARGMKLVTTFHHARNLQRHDQASGSWNSHFPFFDGMPTTSDDPELRYLYGNIPEDEWLRDVWFAKVEEVTRKYQPDIIYFDSWLDSIPENYRLRVCADYLNKSLAWGKEVVIVHKQDDIPLDVSIEDLEKSRKNDLDERPWMTDETISTGSWSYTEDLEIKPASDLLHVLIDIVSKNGVLMLNISPKADGEIPQDQKEVLLTIGEWLDAYGEAIYATKPWYAFGEGPTLQPEGHFDNRDAFMKVKYSGKDVRYTKKDNVIYAIFLGRPDAHVVLKSFAGQPLAIGAVSLLGSSRSVDWSVEQRGLSVTLPTDLPDEMAPVLKITTISP